MIIKDIYYLSNWITKSEFSDDWVIKPTSNEWINNKINLNWIQYFNKYVKNRSIDIYRILIIDDHENHISAEFNEYYKNNNIITVNMLIYLFYLL